MKVIVESANANIQQPNGNIKFQSKYFIKNKNAIFYEFI